MAPPGHAASVPNVPGRKVDNMQQLSFLRDYVRDLCRLSHARFPGAQPVSFEKSSIDLLQSEDYWVCEKSDGQRVLILIVIPSFTGIQEVFLIDRKNDYYKVDGVIFPHHMPKDPEVARNHGMRNHTLMDGELVIDTDASGKQKLVLLLFDLIVLDRELLAHRPLSKRYGRLKSFVYPPYVEYLKRNPAAAARRPFDVQVKRMDLAYGIEMVLYETVPNLLHGNDGLIFTCLDSGYVMGTDPKILKWKPPNENTIDFKLILRFPPDLERDPRGNLPNLCVMPFFELHQFLGASASEDYEFFDELWVEPEEWRQMVESGEQFDDRIVECVWSVDTSPATEPYISQGLTLPPRWRMMRIRDDKHHGNHVSIVEKILKSIRDGVEADELVSAAPAIRAAWKTAKREKRRQEAGQVPASTSVLPSTSHSAYQSASSLNNAHAPRPFDPSLPFGGKAYQGVKGKAPPLASGGSPGLIRR
ncbi:related to mRNA guanylyltransferase [Melanopsichium pennsylvanicum]|uniref:mRNA guanylyltransferase n=2 Tax=Melanopsichium pennsylvanicum TaxID=63383 RepID=A0AAJ4XT48_9BASI|nr:related to mRNA guanylyltransferase [Melanopsichium pennsylvanicum 4]SNX87536.1 related to mRNA guanylyltransferase [Melanopsichium pennsylvanicum]